ncbi:MAG TPA: hypothetical protein VIC55_01120 [Gemmatimonadaceae bacterium]
MLAISRRLRIAAHLLCALAALAAATATVGCADHGGALTTAPSSKPLPLFHLGLIRRVGGGEQFFYGLTVMNCAGDKPYWTFGDRGAKGAPPDTVTYGVPPVGYGTVIGPLPLDPGCYRVLVTGGASARFEIAPGGRVVAHDSTLVTTTAIPDSATH